MFATPLLTIDGASLLPNDAESINYLYITAHDTVDEGFLAMKTCDIVRVFFDGSGYIMSRDVTEGLIYPNLEAADRFARGAEICGPINMDAVFCVKLENSIEVLEEPQLEPSTPITHEYDSIIPYLSTSRGIIPKHGWSAYLSDSGVKIHKSSTRDSFHFTCQFWDELKVESGKTSWLSTPLHVDQFCRKNAFLYGSRRAQLCIVNDMNENDLRSDTRKGCKQGVLLYAGNVSLKSVERFYGAVDDMDSTTKLAISLLLLCYTEAMSQLRLALYNLKGHPNFKKPYRAMKWDLEHVKYRQFPLCTPDQSEVRVIDVMCKAAKISNKLLDYKV